MKKLVEKLSIVADIYEGNVYNFLTIIFLNTIDHIILTVEQFLYFKNGKGIIFPLY